MCCNILLPVVNIHPSKYSTFKCEVFDLSLQQFTLSEFLDVVEWLPWYEACRVMPCAVSLALVEYRSSRRTIVTLDD